MSNFWLILLIMMVFSSIMCKSSNTDTTQKLTDQEIRVIIAFILTIILVISLYVVITMTPMLITEIDKLRKDAFY